MATKTHVPFNERKFTLDGEPVDIEDFIASNSETFEEAAIIRSDILELAEGYHMHFGGGSVPERDLFRLK